MKNYIFVFSTFLLLACAPSTEKKEANNSSEPPIALNKEHALNLYEYAYSCLDQEYPNKLNQVLGDGSYLKSPKELHPAFYGCFDWHSSVHGHWTLVTLLTHFPELKEKEAILQKLTSNITPEHIAQEIAYFDDPHNKNFERTYGWAWLLKLSEALKKWEHPQAATLATTLQPLVDLIADKFEDFLEKLVYPIRVGEHSNTAFGLSFALDYAQQYDPELATAIIKKSTHFYADDKGCPLTWEPSGFDFLSPCLQEAALMRKVLSKEAYIKWLDNFLPNFRKAPERFLTVATVSDRSDGKLAHLDGLNFSRAWCLYEIGLFLENQEMIALANTHFTASYQKMNKDEYAGSHWLASFALYALTSGSSS